MTDIQKNRLDTAARLVQSGQREAFREIVEAMLPVVRAFVAGRSLPGVDIDELVQRTFVEGYSSIGQYKLGTDLKAWLVTIARYQVMMESTRLKRMADYHARYVPVALARQTEALLQSKVEDDLRVSYLRDCMSELPEHARQVLCERYESDRPFAQIAATLGRSEGAIRKQLCLLRQQLHDCVTRKMSMGASYE